MQGVHYSRSSAHDPFLTPVTTIARRTGLSVSHISKIFNPRLPKYPSIHAARRIAAVLGVTVDELLMRLDLINRVRS